MLEKHARRWNAALAEAGHIAAIIACAVALQPASPGRAVEVPDLYRAETIVTGTEEPERTRGFRIGLEEVLIKLSGDARLAGAPRLAPYLDRVHGLVAAFAYEDRMKGLPVRDEQGTRERPHFLRITFDRGRIDAVLQELGLAKWPADRPRLAVWLGVRDARRRYLLSRDGVHGYGQREALKSASRRRGVPIALPTEATGEERGIGYADVEAGNRPKLGAASEALGADGTLLGTLTLDRTGFGWDIRWSLDCRGVRASWSRTGASFDAALRGGIDWAMLLLARAASAPR